VGIYSDPKHVLPTLANGEVRQEFFYCLYCSTVDRPADAEQRISEVRWVHGIRGSQYTMDTVTANRIDDYLARKMTRPWSSTRLIALGKVRDLLRTTLEQACGSPWRIISLLRFVRADRSFISEMRSCTAPCYAGRRRGPCPVGQSIIERLNWGRNQSARRASAKLALFSFDDSP